MFLAIDIGNTNLAFGLLDDAAVVAESRIATPLRRTADELRWLLGHFLDDHRARETVAAAGIASVVFDMTAVAEQAVARLLPDIRCDVIGKSVHPALPIAYEPPSAVGADRICNVTAGIARWGVPLIVVDFGTATTLDVVNRDGVYLGGAILPGIETAMYALSARTSQLFPVQLTIPPSAIGGNTADAIRSGLLYGGIGAVDRLAFRFAEELGDEPMVAATGGLATLLAPHSAMIREVAPGLVLEGIRLICEHRS